MIESAKDEQNQAVVPPYSSGTTGQAVPPLPVPLPLEIKGAQRKSYIGEQGHPAAAVLPPMGKR